MSCEETKLKCQKLDILIVHLNGQVEKNKYSAV